MIDKDKSAKRCGGDSLLVIKSMNRKQISKDELRAGIVSIISGDMTLKPLFQRYHMFKETFWEAYYGLIKQTPEFAKILNEIIEKTVEYDGGNKIGILDYEIKTIEEVAKLSSKWDVFERYNVEYKLIQDNKVSKTRTEEKLIGYDEIRKINYFICLRSNIEYNLRIAFHLAWMKYVGMLHQDTLSSEDWLPYITPMGNAVSAFYQPDIAFDFMLLKLAYGNIDIERAYIENRYYQLYSHLYKRALTVRECNGTGSFLKIYPSLFDISDELDNLGVYNTRETIGQAKVPKMLYNIIRANELGKAYCYKALGEMMRLDGSEIIGIGILDQYDIERLRRGIYFDKTLKNKIMINNSLVTIFGVLNASKHITPKNIENNYPKITTEAWGFEIPTFISSVSPEVDIKELVKNGKLLDKFFEEFLRLKKRGFRNYRLEELLGRLK